MGLTISFTNEEIVRSKFATTLEILNGYIQEAKGDIKEDLQYGPNIVRDRLIEIKDALVDDMRDLVKSME